MVPQIFACGNESAVRLTWQNIGWAITCCGPPGSSVLEFGFQVDSLVYTDRYTADHM